MWAAAQKHSEFKTILKGVVLKEHRLCRQPIQATRAQGLGSLGCGSEDHEAASADTRERAYQSSTLVHSLPSGAHLKMGKTNLKTAKNRRFSGNSVPQAKNFGYGESTPVLVFFVQSFLMCGVGVVFSPMQHFLQRNLELGI